MFLSGKMQQCFFKIPGNTFQVTTKVRRERGKKVKEKDVNITAAQSRNRSSEKER